MINKVAGLFLFLIILFVGLVTFLASDAYADSCTLNYSINPPSPSSNTQMNVTLNNINTSNNLCLVLYKDGQPLSNNNENCTPQGADFSCKVNSGDPGTHTLQVKYGQQSFYPDVPNCQTSVTCNSAEFTTVGLPTPTPTLAPARQNLCQGLAIDPANTVLAPWQPLNITATAIPSAQVQKFRFAFYNSDNGNQIIKLDPNSDGFYVDVNSPHSGDTSLKQTFYFADLNKVDLNTGQKPKRVQVNGYFIDQNGQSSLGDIACTKSFRIVDNPTSPTCTITGLPATVDRSHGGTYPLTASTSDTHVKRLQLWYSFKDSPGPSDWRNIGGTDNQACSTSSGTPCTKTLTLAPSDIPADASKLTAVCNAYYKDENNPLAAAPVGADIMCGGSPAMASATIDNPYKSPTSGTTWSYCGSGSSLQANLATSCLDTGDFNGKGPHDLGNFDVWKDAFTRGLRGLPASISNCSGMTVDLKAFNAWRRKDLGL